MEGRKEFSPEEKQEGGFFRASEVNATNLKLFKSCSITINLCRF